MQVFLSIVKIIVGVILLLAAPYTAAEFTIGTLIMYAAGGFLTFWGVITILRVIIDAIKGRRRGQFVGR